jgi:hypothetical protein
MYIGLPDEAIDALIYFMAVFQDRHEKHGLWEAWS